MELMQISDCSKSDSPTICELLKLGLKELRQESQLAAAQFHSIFPFFKATSCLYFYTLLYIINTQLLKCQGQCRDLLFLFWPHGKPLYLTNDVLVAGKSDYLWK